MSQHSKLGPSASERWLNCPGSVLLTKDMPSLSSQYAAEGNAAHTLSEWSRLQQKPADHWRGETIHIDGYEFEVDQEMIDGVNEFVEYVEQWPGLPLYEARVRFDRWVPGGFGTLDDGRIQDNLTRVTDLKYGKGIQVWADDNPQLKLYAIGTYESYKHLYQFDHFILTVHQPRLNHVDPFEISLKELLEWMDDVVKPTAELAAKPGAPIVAGDHCQFCPAKRTCVTRAEFANNAMGGFENLDERRQLLTNDEIAVILPKLDSIKRWCSDVENHAIETIKKGEPVGDYKTVEGRSNRVWRYGEKKIETALRLEGFADIFQPPKVLSPAQAEKKFGKGKLDALIYKPPGKDVLVPGSDKREATNPTAKSEFDAIGD